MAVERGYQAQVGVRAQDVAVQTSPDAYGAQLGSAIGELGQTVHRGDIQAYQIERKARADSEATGFARNFAEWRANMDGIIREQRSGAAPGGVGHQQAVRDAYEKGRETLLSGITEDSVRNSASTQFSTFGASLLEREGTWAEGKRVAKVVDDTQVLSDIGANRVRQMSDQGAYQEEVKLGYAFVDSLQVDDDTKAKLRRELVDQKYAMAFLDGMTERDPIAARAMMEIGEYNDILEPAQLEKLRNGADMEIRRAAAAERTRATAVRQDVNETTDLAIKAVKDGVLYNDADLATLEQQAVAAGLPPAKVYEIQDVRALNTVKREFQDASPAVIADSLREIDVAIAKGGAGADPKLVQRRNHMQTVLGQRRSEISNDQLGFAARNGITAPAVDWENPQTAAVQERLKALRVASGAAGGVPIQYFDANDLPVIKGWMQSGKGGTLKALAAARAYGGQDAIAAAKQLAPDDPVFAHLVTLNPEVAGIALAGREHLKAFPDANRPKQGDDNYHELKDAFARQDQQVNSALESLDPKQRSAVWLTARELLAGYVAQGFGPLTPDMRQRAINNALWANGRDGQRRGGLATWGDKMFLRPSTMDSAEFTQRVQWTVAHGPGGGPVNADGSPASLARAYPVFLRPNTYLFQGKDGRPLRKKDGSQFIVWTGKGAPK